MVKPLGRRGKEHGVFLSPNVTRVPCHQPPQEISGTENLHLERSIQPISALTTLI